MGGVESSTLSFSIYQTVARFRRSAKEEPTKQKIFLFPQTPTLKKKAITKSLKAKPPSALIF